jgi:hypothetical protein
MLPMAVFPPLWRVLYEGTKSGPCMSVVQSSWAIRMRADDDEGENKPVWPTRAVGGRNIQAHQTSKHTTANAHLRGLSRVGLQRLNSPFIDKL